MSVEAAYSFLSWTRRGLANALTAAPAAGTLRPSLTIAFDLAGDQGGADQTRTISKGVSLVGPGDIIGISTQAIVRQEPASWVKDFLPNYLPFIEFYDEDFPWRHSPEVPDPVLDRLQPWIALVVLAADEFTDIPASGPLPAIQVNALGQGRFPSWSQRWAWAHVQVNGDIASDGAGNQLSAADVCASLEAQTSANPDIACSRLICPRQLDARTTYHAFLIPAYEAGRCAGLNEAAPQSATQPGWGGGQTKFPYYHRWEFGTASRGDFEYLVSLLKPRAIDSRVGTRDMYVGNPGGGVRTPRLPDGKPPILALEGALRSPQTTPTAWPLDGADPFQQDVREFVNKADGVQLASLDSDPVVTPPLYGRWHSLHPKITPPAGATHPYDANALWLDELNLDPRHRAAAGRGGDVVRAGQEGLMNQAWWQVGDVLEANRKIQFGQMALAASRTLYARHIVGLPSDALFALSQPVQTQLFGSEETIHFKVRNSPLPAAVLSPAFRRLTRPLGKLARAAFPGAAPGAQQGMLARLHDGEISHAPPKRAPAGAITLAGLAAHPDMAALDSGPGRPLRRALLAILIAVLGFAQAVLNGIFAVIPVVRAPLAGASRAISGALATLRALRDRPTPVQALAEAAFTPQAIARLPANAAFRITAPDAEVKATPGGTDSVEALRFKSALSDMSAMMARPTLPDPVRPVLDFGHIERRIRDGIDPNGTIVTRVYSTIDQFESARAPIPETFVPALAYPIFRRPMYEALRDLSTEHLIPNMNLVPSNTVALLAENRRFIEAYMMGLNHEMARELLWRGYPTDNRGSYFRQFWDVRDSRRPANMAKEAWEERNRDIPEIHNWSMRAALGGHPNRPTASADDNVVLLIRGALLARFPNVVIYANRAAWPLKPDGVTPDKTKARRLAESTTDAERTANAKYPIYSATVAPDVTFLGFDLKLNEVRGDADDPGWYFCFKERPGETLFGMDVEDSPTPFSQWDDLSWRRLPATAVVGRHIVLPPATGTQFKPSNPTILGQTLVWNEASNAAAIAAILYQDPVLVAVHASAMLP